MVATRIAFAVFEETNRLERVDRIDGETVESTPSSDRSSSLAAPITGVRWNHVYPSSWGDWTALTAGS